MQAIILAGGKGTRLKPFTTTIPKPLMPLSETPIIEVLIRQLKRDGFKDIVVAVNHLKELVRSFLGDGRKWGVKISYSVEDKFLGTAGALRIIKSHDENFVVVNGDTLTTIDFRDIYNFHVKMRAIATISTCVRNMNVDFGVVEKDGKNILLKFTEKPTYPFEVSMGVNVFNKKALSFIGRARHMGLNELVLELKRAGERVVVYPFRGRWLDIGHVSDYETANNIFDKEKKRFLKGCYA